MKTNRRRIEQAEAMTIRYQGIVPWGRNYDEYVRMFALTEDDLKLNILGCGDGPASFNCECSARGGRVVSVDPLYILSPAALEAAVEAAYPSVMRETEAHREQFRWDVFPSVADLGRARMAAMKRFLASYEQGRLAGRYVAAALPDLPFADGAFGIALCSHLLFLYTDDLSYDFHAAAVAEMLRVAREVRIFPLLDMNGRRSPYVEKIVSGCGHMEAAVTRVDYEFQIGGNEMLTIRRPRRD